MAGSFCQGGIIFPLPGGPMSLCYGGRASFPVIDNASQEEGKKGRGIVGVKVTLDNRDDLH